MSRSHRHRRSRASSLPAVLRRVGSQRAVAGLLLPAFAGTAATAVCALCAAPAGELRSLPDRAPASAVSASPVRSTAGAFGYDAPLVVDQTPARGDRAVVLLWQAYTHAVDGAPVGCHLPLSLLAAIGQVESGSLSGRALDAGHRAVPAVLGPVLDGSGYAAIADTDHGALDGNRRWDRAVGPMQILPATWADHGRDGDGDGRRDPQDIDDAAATAAAYLCAGGRDLADGGDLAAALLDYDPSAAYVNLVLAWKVNLDAQLSPPAVTTLLASAPVAFPAAVGTPVVRVRPAVRHPEHGAHGEKHGGHAGHAVTHALPAAHLPAEEPAEPEPVPVVPMDDGVDGVDGVEGVDVPSGCPVPTEGPVESPADDAADDAADDDADDDADRPAEEPAEQASEDPAEEPSPDATGCVPGEVPGEAPVEVPLEAPAAAASVEPAPDAS